MEHKPFLVAIGIILPVASLASKIARGAGSLKLGATIDVLTCGLLITLPIGLSTYVACRLNMPLADGVLGAMDRSLGFDWRAFIASVDHRSWLAEILGLAYQSFAFQLLALPALAVQLGNRPRAYLFVINYALICFLASLLAIWFPALGTYSICGVPADALEHINAYYGYASLDQFNAVRNEPDFVFIPGRMAGIITFPSVHAAVAGLCIWAAWPFRHLRIVFLGLNLLMAMSALSHANHYLSDVIAGLAISFATISMTSRAADVLNESRMKRNSSALAASVQ